MATVSAAPIRMGWRKGFAGELWAEFFGCFILISFGDGVVAMLWALPGRGAVRPGCSSPGRLAADHLGLGLAVAFAVYVAGGITGAHINPAVTLGAAIRQAASVGQGPGLLGRAGAGVLRRRRARVPGLQQRDQPL